MIPTVLLSVVVFFWRWFFFGFKKNCVNWTPGADAKPKPIYETRVSSHFLLESRKISHTEHNVGRSHTAFSAVTWRERLLSSKKKKETNGTENRISSSSTETSYEILCSKDSRPTVCVRIFLCFSSHHIQPSVCCSYYCCSSPLSLSFSRFIPSQHKNRRHSFWIDLELWEKLKTLVLIPLFFSSD